MRQCELSKKIRRVSKVDSNQALVPLFFFDNERFFKQNYRDDINARFFTSRSKRESYNR